MGASVPLAYDDRGSGEPSLLCLPGWCENRTAFTRLVELEGQHRRALSIDWRGHGDPERFRKTRASLFSSWMGRGNVPEIIRHIADEMGAYGQEMWAWAAGEIVLAYGQWGSPQHGLASIHPALPVLHLYSQPKDDAYLWAQQAFGDAHPWFRVRRLSGETHFPSLEIPEETAEAIETFIREPFGRAALA